MIIICLIIIGIPIWIYAYRKFKGKAIQKAFLATTMTLSIETLGFTEFGYLNWNITFILELLYPILYLLIDYAYTVIKRYTNSKNKSE